MIILELESKPPEPSFGLHFVFPDQTRVRVGGKMHTPMEIRNLLGNLRREGLLPSMSPEALAVFNDIASNDFSYPRYTQLCRHATALSTSPRT